jgi:phosphatidylglycerophosphate synthase
MSAIVSPELRARVRGMAIPIALAFGRLGLTPNALTVIGFGIAVVAAVGASQGAWALAAFLVIFGGVFDLFDGALARATNRVSRVGAFLDSVFDRAGESILFIGIGIGSLAAGFTRAKSESLGFTPGTGMANVGLAPREVRLVIVTIGLLATAATGGAAAVDCGNLFCVNDAWGYGRLPLAATLALITVLATVTTLQRILHVVRQPQSSSEEHA